MNSYIIYKSDWYAYGLKDTRYCVAEVLDTEEFEVFRDVQKDLIKNGYVILDISEDRKYIKCVKLDASKEEENNGK